MDKIYKKVLVKLSISAFMLWGSTGFAQTSLNVGGTGNRVETAANFDLTNGFTVEYDVYLNTLQDYNGMVTKGCSNVASPLDVYINTSGTMTVFYGDCSVTGGGNSSYNFSAGTWYHIAHTYDPNIGQGQLYVNGALTDTWGGIGAVGNGTGPMMIGDRADNVTDANSKFDNVRVWSGVRTAGDIYNYQHVCLTGTETGLEILYNMEEGAGTTLTDLATANGSQNGNIIGAVTWDAGLACGSITPAAALNFDGVDDNISIADNAALNMTNAITIESWIKTTGMPTNEQYIVTKNENSFYVGLNVNGSVGKASFYLDGVSSNWLYTTSTTINDDNWHHIACTYDGAIMSIYVDGILDNSTTNTGTITTGADNVYLGCRDNNQFFQGSMDEFRIWNRALCATEIQNNMNAELPMPQTGLVAYYKFNEGVFTANNSTVTTAADSTGNGHNGTLNNFALNGTTSNWVAPGAVTNGVYASTFTTPTITVSGDMSICAGTTTTLTASGADTYTWSTSDNTDAIVVTPTLTTNTYSVSGTLSGCATNMAVTTVTVNALPVISSQSGNVKACGDVAASFSVSSADANDSYQWYYQNTVAPYDGNIIDGSYTEENYNSNNMTIDSLITGNYNGYAVYCVVTNTSNCSTTSENDTITVYAAPTATAMAGTILCNGASTTVTVSANGGTPAYIGDGTYTVTAGSYTYTVTDANSCAVTTTITVSQPNAITTVISPTVCAGSGIMVGTHFYATAGTYTDILTSHNGCDSTVTTHLTVNHVTAAFGWGAATCQCPVIGFMDSSYTTASDPIVAWNWTFAGGTPATSNVHSPGSVTFSYGNHVVCLKVTTQGGCTDSICKNVFENVMGINEYSHAPMLTVYPNPAQNNFVVETNAAEKQLLEVFDINGKLVLSQNINGTTNIDATNMVAGVYNISLTGEYGITNKRLVLVK